MTSKIGFVAVNLTNLAIVNFVAAHADVGSFVVPWFLDSYPFGFANRASSVGVTFDFAC